MYRYDHGWANKGSFLSKTFWFLIAKTLHFWKGTYTEIMWITWPLPDLRSKRQDSLNNDGTLNRSEKIKKPCVHPTADVQLITLSLKIFDVQRQLEAWKSPTSADQLWSLLWTSRWYYYTLIHKITFMENMHHVHRSKADNIKLWQTEIMSTPILVRVFVLLIGGHKEREKAKRKW